MSHQHCASEHCPRRSPIVLDMATEGKIENPVSASLNFEKPVNSKKRTLTAHVSSDSVSDSDLLAACRTAESGARVKALERETLAICTQADHAQKVCELASKFRKLAETARKLAKGAAALADEAAELAGS